MKLLRGVVLVGLFATVVACGSPDYRSMTPDQVCGLLTAVEASALMKPITEDPLTKQAEQGSPDCRYGAGEGRPYVRVAIQQSSMRGDGENVTVAGRDALEVRPNTGCSVSITLEENLYLLAVVESWESDDDASCVAARGALEKAYPRLNAG